jgi:hypothetical protein
VFDRAESEVVWWYMQREAILGIRGSGFEGSAASVWDDARSARAHGLAIDEDSGAYARLYTGRTSIGHQVAVARAARIGPAIALLPDETHKIFVAACATCTASPLVASFFNTESRAPLVGLGVLMWYELQPEEKRPPSTLLREWDAALKSSGGAPRALLRPVKNRAVDVYQAALGIYDEVRRHVARERVR